MRRDGLRGSGPWLKEGSRDPSRASARRRSRRRVPAGPTGWSGVGSVTLLERGSWEDVWLEGCDATGGGTRVSGRGSRAASSSSGGRSSGAVRKRDARGFCVEEPGEGASTGGIQARSSSRGGDDLPFGSGKGDACRCEPSRSQGSTGRGMGPTPVRGRVSGRGASLSEWGVAPFPGISLGEGRAVCALLLPAGRSDVSGRRSVKGSGRPAPESRELRSGCADGERSEGDASCEGRLDLSGSPLGDSPLGDSPLGS